MAHHTARGQTGQPAAVRLLKQGGEQRWRDLDMIVDALRERRAKLLIIDTPLRCARIGSYRASGDVLAALLREARRSGFGAVGINHNNKAARNAMMASLGSVGIVGLARSQLFSGRDPRNTKDHHYELASAKANLGGVDALRYRTGRLESGVIVVRWGDLDPALDADKLAAGSREDRRLVDRAMEILRIVLIDRPVPWKWLVETCRAHDHRSGRPPGPPVHRGRGAAIAQPARGRQGSACAAPNAPSARGCGASEAPNGGPPRWLTSRST